MKNLDKIAIKCGTDKSSEIHNYCEKYERYLPFERSESISILEIGVLGGSSLKMWSEYYSNASILGIDINSACQQYASPNIAIEIGSQTDADFLSRVAKKYGPFDLIIDDGSHMQSHVLFSFNCLFKSLKSQGIYVVEDASCSYWKKYEGGMNKPGTSVEYFKTMVDAVNFCGLKQIAGISAHARREDLLIERIVSENIDMRTDLYSINFLNGLILITKR
jgi:hypothetical protein